MNHQDHIRLLCGGISEPGGTWADLGSGTGAFTLALADLIGAEGYIYSVDRDQRALDEQKRALSDRPLTMHYLRADFTHPLELPPLDGMVMANSLHFQQDKNAVLTLVHGYLKPGGRLILVEYNTDRGNTWVPYPLSYSTWEKLAAHNGFSGTRLLTTQPSRFLGEIFSAVSFRSS
jgi:ubiquinone/menaquinone biosynthesis C-methylase UbiE